MHEYVVPLPHAGGTARLVTRELSSAGPFPNNRRRPLLVYQGAVASPAATQPAIYERLFAANGWGGSWRNGVYGYHHYHSTAHEVLGVYAGRAEVQFGGDTGPVLAVAAGDVVLIPAGVAHKNVGASADFRVVGAYPRGQRPDLLTGQPGERPHPDAQVEQVAMPDADPVYGPEGWVVQAWRV